MRELRNVLERAVILAKGGWIETMHLPPYLRSGADRSGQRLGAGLTMAEAERLLILDTLKSCSGNKAEAGKGELGGGRGTNPEQVEILRIRTWADESLHAPGHGLGPRFPPLPPAVLAYEVVQVDRLARLSGELAKSGLAAAELALEQISDLGDLEAALRKFAT